MRKPRATENVVAVFQAMLEWRRPWYGLELANNLGIGTASIYLVLDRLEREGWVVADWEDIDPRVQGRPRRRHYRLTPEGAAEGQRMLASYVPRVRTTSVWSPDGANERTQPA